MAFLVKQFFSKKIAPEPVKPVEVAEVDIYQYDFSEISTILGRDWFVDIDGIIEYLDGLDEDEYQYAWDTRASYSWRIQRVIDSSLNKYGSSRVVKDISNKEMTLFDNKGVKELQKKLEVLWNTHRVESCLKRVGTETDRQILDTNKELDDVKKRKANYTPKFVPSWKVAEKDPKLENFNVEIQHLTKLLSDLEASKLKEFVEWEEKCKEIFLAGFYKS